MKENKVVEIAKKFKGGERPNGKELFKVLSDLLYKERGHFNAYDINGHKFECHIEALSVDGCIVTASNPRLYSNIQFLIELKNVVKIAKVTTDNCGKTFLYVLEVLEC